MIRAALLAVAIGLVTCGCCEGASSEHTPSAQEAAASSQPAAPKPAPSPKNLSIGKLTADDVRGGVERAGWSVTAELGTQFDSCKTTQLDVRKGSQEGTAQLHECTDEYDARRRETAVKNGSGDAVIERAGGRMFEVQVKGDGAEARKLFSEVLGR